MTKIVPREYQNVGIQWLRENRRGFNTDQPGLGKTLQAAEAAELPALVVCPTYLVKQWADFLTTQYPERTVSYALKGRWKKIAAMRRQADWYVINKDALRTIDPKDVPRVKTVILDEAHHFRNRRAEQSRAVAKLTKDPDLRVYLLTATPIWKSADDLWMQLHIIQPKIFSSYNAFVRAFCVTDDSPYGTKVVGIKKEMRQELEDLLSIVRVGRTYADVGRELPELVENFIKVEFPYELRKKYNELRDYFRLEFEDADDQQIFLSSASVMHTLRQVTFFAGKLEAIRDLLDDAPGPHLIYTWYKDHAEELARYIDRGAEVITGDIPPADRGRLAKAAAAQGRPIVATIASLSEGVDLSMCRSVIYAEENWPPGSNYQSLSRVRRDRNASTDGPSEPVLVYYVHAVMTIDEVIHRVSKAREATAHDLLRETLN